MKLLTIIVPSYNMEDFLAKNCDSMLIGGDEQAWLDIVLVNDGSTDQTSAIAHSYATRFPAVFRVVDKPNGHYGSCVNAGLSIAKGVYCKILDADDYVDTDAFRRYVQRLKQIGEGEEIADLIISDWVSITPSGKVIEESAYTFLAQRGAVADLWEMWLPLHAIAWRTEMLRAHHYRQTEGCAYTDTEWITIPRAWGKRYAYIDEVVATYLLGRDGQSVNATTFARDFQVSINLWEGMLKARSAILEGADEHQCAAFNLRCLRDIQTVYKFALLGFQGVKTAGDIAAFDRMLKIEDPQIYQAVEKNKCRCRILGLRIKFYYVTAWRKTLSGTWWRKMLYDYMIAHLYQKKK